MQIYQQLYRVRVAASILDLPRSTLYRLIERGQVRAVRLPSPTGAGRYILRIPASELRKWTEPEVNS